jgi:hypothetical protein
MAGERAVSRPSFYDLPDIQKSEIEAARVELVKRLKLFRITFLLNSLPASADPSPLDGGVTPDAALTGNPHLESIA